MTEQECKAHAYPGKVQYYDFTTKQWASVDVPCVRWFDGRDLTRETVARTKDEFRATVDERLAKLKHKAEDDPTPKRLAELAAYEKYVADQFQVNLKKFDAEKRAARAWLAKLDATRDLGKQSLRCFVRLKTRFARPVASRRLARLGLARPSFSIGCGNCCPVLR